VAPSVPRAELLNDLAHLREILDDIEAEPEAWEALARIVGALKLTDEEETWLEEQ
jgi:hypothetical protein